MKKFNKNFITIIPALFVFFLFGFIVPITVQAAAINTATNINVTPSTYQYTTFKGVPIYRLHITNTGDAPDTILSLTPTPSGNVDDTLITLHFFNDVNDNGIVDQGDINLGASTHFASDNTKQTFTFPTPVAVPVGTTSILITADGGPAVGNAQIFTLSMALSTDILMGTVAVGVGGFPKSNTSPLTISNTAPSLSITNGANDPIAKTATVNQAGIVVKQLSITAAATSDSIVSLAITPAGSENDTNVSSTKFYIDTGTVPGMIDGSDILLAKTPTTYSINNGKEIFTFLNPFQIAGNTSVNILYTYDLGSGVIGGNTLTAQLVAVSDAVAGSGINISSNSSSVSSTITIVTSGPTLAQSTVIPVSTVKANSTAKVIGAFSVTETAGITDHINQFTIENKTALTAVSADINSVSIYSDSGVLGIIDGSDTLACAEATTNTTTNFDAGGSLITFTCSIPISIGANATQNYLAVVTTTSSATNGRTMAAKINAHLVTASNWAVSDLQTTNPVTIDTTAPITPTVSPIAGTYTGTQSVSLFSIGSDSIRFTTDGSIPSCSVGILYISAINIFSSETINAIGCDNAGNQASAPFTYTINITPIGSGGLVSAPIYAPIINKIKKASATLTIVSMYPIATVISGCNNKAIGFSITTGQSCFGNAIIVLAITPVTSYDFGTTILTIGSKGDAVIDLQRFLNVALNSYLVVDGQLGLKTSVLIKQWQENNGLIVDGLVGIKTKTLMNIESVKN